MKDFINDISEINLKIELEKCRQLSLLNESEFIKLLNDTKVVTVNKEHLVNLWYLGFVRADIIQSTQLIEQEGITLLDEKGGEYTYSDCRCIESKPDGYEDAFQNIKKYPFEIKLFFHPFRCYVVWHLQKHLKFSPFPFQTLQYKDAFQQMTSYHIEIRKNLTSGTSWNECVNKWNDFAALCVISEPAVHNFIFNRVLHVGNSNFEEIQEKLQKLGGEITELFKLIGEKEILDIHGEICRDAETVDSNKDLHLIIRLMSASERLKLKGHIALSVCFLTMAECLRRSLEIAFDRDYPEEDECGYGIVYPDAKITLQGNTRVLDGDRVVANQFLRRFGLDYGIRLNIYVEGDTEYEALESEFSGNSSVMVINLRGNFVEKHGKGVSFRESLRNDIKAKTFSVILLDGDVSDNLRAVKKAAEDDEICGMFFVSKPDFELGNFSLGELAQVVCTLDNDESDSGITPEKIEKAVDGVASGKEFFKAIRAEYPKLSHIGKGKEWGCALKDFARKNSKSIQFGDEQDRLINRVIWIGYQCCSIPYEYTRKNKKVDPVTGSLVDR